MQEKIKNAIQEVVKDLGIEQVDFTVEHPTELSHGDYSTNIAMVIAQKIDENPRVIAEKITLGLTLALIQELEKIEIAGPGFINFTLSDAFLNSTLLDIEKNPTTFGKTKGLGSEKILIEYTDPNPFKQMHIGHLMSNAIGEAISRLAVWRGAEVKRANYQGDIGPHVAKALWGMKALHAQMPAEDDSLLRKVEFLGNAYAHGATRYEENDSIKTEINQINVALYKKSNEEYNNLYTLGRTWSLAYFEELYQKLGTHFDFSFFESEVFSHGVRLVREHMKDVFEESEGAVIFRGEDHGLHTRVFITKNNTPTYEAKELGLHYAKKEAYPFTRSIIITADEQKSVFQVGLKAFEQIDKDTASRIEHITHGFMFGPGGKKMASRTGDVISATEILREVTDAVTEKMKERDVFNKEETAEVIAIAALKYQILKQAPGKNIIFDIEHATSFEGNSGPYLQYTTVRARSLVVRAKGESMGMHLSENLEWSQNAKAVLRLLYRFPEAVERAGREYAPQHLLTYLTDLASSFNTFYGNEKIIDKDDFTTTSKLVLTHAVSTILTNGLGILAMNVPEEM